jgi:hypothetical protein
MLQYALFIITLVRTVPLSVLLDGHWLSRLGNTLIG